MDDQGALSGLRGYAAVHIMIFHSFYYSKAHMHLHASVSIYVNINSLKVNQIKVLWFQIQMPLFFLLSGFCLTLAYGRKQYAGFDTCCGPCRVVDTLSHRFFCCGSCQKKSINVKPEDYSDLPVFDSWKFYFNRFSRVVPVYWFCMLLGVPLIFLGNVCIKLVLVIHCQPINLLFRIQPIWSN